MNYTSMCMNVILYSPVPLVFYSILRSDIQFYLTITFNGFYMYILNCLMARELH